MERTGGEQVSLIIFIRRGRQAGRVEWGKSGVDCDNSRLPDTSIKNFKAFIGEK